MKGQSFLLATLSFSALWIAGCAGSRLQDGKGQYSLAEDPCARIDQAHVAITPTPREHEGWMIRHKQVLELNKRQDVQLVFIGNSLTQRWEKQGAPVWNEYYAKRNAVNMGFDGDGTQNVLWRLDHGEIDNISPKLVVLMIGSNHVNGSKIKEIADGIKAICCRIRTRLPATKILLMAILPRGDASAAAAYRLNKASEEASKIADGRMIFYLNISEKFLDEDGNISSDLMTVDGVHLSFNGYKKLAEEMEPVIAKHIGQKPE